MSKTNPTTIFLKKFLTQSCKNKNAVLTAIGNELTTIRKTKAVKRFCKIHLPTVEDHQKIAMSIARNSSYGYDLD